jgi:L-alanine-DL-glutamate epimerase-like enolase superfamily enzyme
LIVYSHSLVDRDQRGAWRKISGYEVFPVANPRPDVGGPVWMFVRLDSDACISGYGEVFTSSAYSPPLTLARVIGDFIEEFAVGQDPANTEAFFLSVYNSHYTRSSDLLKMAMTAGVEIAMWDLVGKDLGRPVHALLGGPVRDSVRMYSYLTPPAGVDSARFWADDEAITARTREYLALGFTALKVDPFPLLTGADTLAGKYVPVQPTEAQLTDAERILGPSGARWAHAPR